MRCKNNNLMRLSALLRRGSFLFFLFVNSFIFLLASSFWRLKKSCAAPFRSSTSHTTLTLPYFFLVCFYDSGSVAANVKGIELYFIIGNTTMVFQLVLHILLVHWCINSVRMLTWQYGTR